MAYWRVCRKDELIPWKEGTKKHEGHGLYSPLMYSSPSSSFSVIVGLQTWNFLTFLFWRVSTYTNSSGGVGSPDISSGHTLIWTSSGYLNLRGAIGEGWRGAREAQSSSKCDAPWSSAEHRDSVKLFCDISNPLSAFVLSSSDLVSVSPLLSCLSVYFLSVFTLNLTASTYQETCSEWIM